MKIGDVSFWYADMGMPATRRPALAGDTQADVAIIGAGYTGLWTAWYLMQAQPDLKVARAREGIRRLRRLGAERRLVPRHARLGP